MPGSLSWIASLRCRLWRKVVVSRPCRRRRTDFRVTYLLDTNAVIAVLKNQPASVRHRLRRARSEGASIAVSSLVMYELWYGVARSERVGIRARGRSALARLDERWLMDPKRLWEPQATPLQAPIRLATVFQQNQELEKCTRADTSHLSPLTSHFSLPPPLFGSASLPGGSATRPTSSF